MIRLSPMRRPAALVARPGLALLLCLAWAGFSPLLRAGEFSLTAIAKGYLVRAIGSARGLMASPAAPAAEPSALPVEIDPDVRAREVVLAKARAAIFLEKGDYHFTQSKWGASPAPYQIDGLKLVALPEGAIGPADRALGIDRRISYEFRCRAYRTYEEPKGWGAWKPGVPPQLESLTLIRQHGVWKVSVSPVWAYSLR